MNTVKGIGGIFFKCKDPRAINAWYRKHLGFKVNEYGSLFQGRDHADPDEETLLQWAPFEEDTDYFEPCKKDFMINYRVDDLESLINQLKDQGVAVIAGIRTYPYGKFAHIMDPEGNKIELWEPIVDGLKSELESQS